MTWITTSMLLEQLRDPQGEAWEVFVDRFRIPLESFARRLGLPDSHREDVVQDVLLEFVTSFRAGRYDRRRGRLRTWLFTIARGRILDAGRRIRRERDRREGGERTSFWEAVPGADELENAFERAWQEAVFDSGLQRLRQEMKPRSVEVFERTALHGVPAEEVAREFGMTRNAVDVTKHRALKRLRELSREFEDEA